MDRLPFLLALGICAALAVLQVIGRVATWGLEDLNVYLAAGQAWVETGNPFAVAVDALPISTYRYAPWFAAVWVPLGSVPYGLVAVVWSGVLLIATVAVTVVIVREHGRDGLPFALLMFAVLFGTSAGGNVQPLLIAGLYFGLHGRAGPLAVGVAASLKLVPILFVLPWAVRGEWRKVTMAVGLAVALLAPTLLFTLPPQVAEPGITSLIDTSPLLYGAVASLALASALYLGRGRYAWGAASVAVLLAIPRMLPLDLSFLAPGSMRRR